MGVIYNTLLHSNEGNLGSNTSQTLHFSTMNDNKNKKKTIHRIIIAYK